MKVGLDFYALGCGSNLHVSGAYKHSNESLVSYCVKIIN